jgi:hypothetical protein
MGLVALRHHRAFAVELRTYLLDITVNSAAICMKFQYYINVIQKGTDSRRNGRAASRTNPWVTWTIGANRCLPLSVLRVCWLAD